MRVILLCAGVAACSGGKEAATTRGDAAAGADSAAADSASAGGDGAAPAVGPYFTTPMFWNRDVSGIAKATDSDALVAALEAAGGWGNSNVMQVDFSIEVLTADATAPKQTFAENSDWATPDCDDEAV